MPLPHLPPWLSRPARQPEHPRAAGAGSRRRLLGALALAPLAPPLAAQVRDPADAVDKAGRQRMLSQRCAKAWLALGQQVQTPWAARVLAQSVALFEQQQTELLAWGTEPTVHGLYEELGRSWQAYRGRLLPAAPARERAEDLLVHAAAVLRLAHQGTLLVERQSGTPLARLVNIAGRQRMLSQRMAALSLGLRWGAAPPRAAADLAQAQEEFQSAHRLLKAAPETSPAIAEALAMVEAQQVFFDQALRLGAGPEAGTQAASHLFTTSERILQLMESVTALYARAGR